MDNVKLCKVLPLLQRPHVIVRRALSSNFIFLSLIFRFDYLELENCTQLVKKHMTVDWRQTTDPKCWCYKYVVYFCRFICKQEIKKLMSSVSNSSYKNYVWLNTSWISQVEVILFYFIKIQYKFFCFLYRPRLICRLHFKDCLLLCYTFSNYTL